MAHPTAVVQRALALLHDGLPVGEVSAAVGVSAHTLRNWQRGLLPAAVRREQSGEGSCATCGGPRHEESLALSAEAYCYLLGVYLGDGWLYLTSRTAVLRVTMDERYPGIVGEVAAAIGAVRGRPPGVGARRGERCLVITSYWKSWLCLFPQHGTGKKHHRPIVLAEWQQRIVDRYPEALLRGLIHTDGWRGENRVVAKGKQYAYPRYQFSSRSDDIRRIFTDACDRAGIAWRPWGRWHVSVARRDAVARMDEFIGPKT